MIADKELPQALASFVATSPAPQTVQLVLERVIKRDPTSIDRFLDADGATHLARAVVAVSAASNSLGRLIVADPVALDVLESSEPPEPREANRGSDARWATSELWVTDERSMPDATDAYGLARFKRLAMLRIAALDLTGRLTLEQTGAALGALASEIFERALRIASGGGGAESCGLAVIGMGKFGAAELNYASDVDVLLVAGDESNESASKHSAQAGPVGALARQMLELARPCFRIDLDLRPEGRAGPLVRSIQGYESYWQRWAQPWERQALIKASLVAGDVTIGSAFTEAASRQVWQRPFSSDELAHIRTMKARSEALVSRHGRNDSEIKRGTGGIRDVEFAVQLLQLVHGRTDPRLRVRSTLAAIGELASAGCIDPGDAETLSSAYRFLRTVEHRIQLVEEEQTHALPPRGPALERLARVVGFRDHAGASAAESFEEELRRQRSSARSVHERLFFRPLLDALASADERGFRDGPTMAAGVIEERLAAFGFAGAKRTSRAVTELARGLSRTSRLMEQMLPLILDWLSVTPDPDLGLLGMRNLVSRPHHRALLQTTFRESSQAAKRLCSLLGTSRVLTEALMHNPELILSLGDDTSLSMSDSSQVTTQARSRLARHSTRASRRHQLKRLREYHTVRIATADLAGLTSVEQTGAALSAVADGILQAALEDSLGTGPSDATDSCGFCVVGLGRLGGAELSYMSDLDVIFVARDANECEQVAEQLVRLIHGETPSEQVATLDTTLRPEGSQGRLVRDLAGYETWFSRWGRAWERQALLRARIVAGDRTLGNEFMSLVDQFVHGRVLGAQDLAEIRRLKARMERERISPREDPEFHLKLGRGSLSDVEWTAQILQLEHGIREPGTVGAIESLRRLGLITAPDAEVLLASYRFCEMTRNRWFLVGALPGGTSPGDSLPTQPHQLSKLARSLGTTPSALRDDYRRVTRRARALMERLFYASGG